MSRGKRRAARAYGESGTSRGRGLLERLQSLAFPIGELFEYTESAVGPGIVLVTPRHGALEFVIVTRAAFKSLPGWFRHSTGLYVLLGDGKRAYVGKGQFSARCAQHEMTREWWSVAILFREHKHTQARTAWDETTLGLFEPLVMALLADAGLALDNDVVPAVRAGTTSAAILGTHGHIVEAGLRRVGVQVNLSERFTNVTVWPNAATSTAARRPPLRFSQIGLKPGDVLAWAHDPAVTTTVCNDRQISFRGERMSMSKATLLLLDRDQTSTGNRATIQGTEHWLFEGERLTDRRERLAFFGT